MRYTNQQYAEAFLLALDNQKSEPQRREATRRFLSILQKNGDSPKLQTILRILEKKYLHKEGLKKVSLEYAGRLSPDTKKDIEKILGRKIIITERKNPDLLAGIKILVNDEILIDASAKRQMDKLFRRQNFKNK